MNQQDQIQYVDQDAERIVLRGAVRRTRPKARLWIILFILSIVVPLGILGLFLRLALKSNPRYWGDLIIWFSLSIIPLYGINKPFRNAVSDYQEAFRQCYLPQALGKDFSGLQVQRGSGLSWEALAHTDILYPGEFLESQSIIRGQYRNIPFEQSEIKTMISVRRLTRTGRYVYFDKTIFRGRWTALSLNGSRYPELQILERGFRNKRHRLSFLNRYKLGRRVFVKDLGFDMMFRIYAEDPNEVDSVLTPELRAQIRSLALHTRGRLMLCFTGGELHLAVQTRRAAFAPPSVFLPFREERAIKSVQRKAAPFTQLLDELLLDKKRF